MPACLAALVIASPLAATTARSSSCSAASPTVTTSTLDAVAVLDLGGDGPQRAGHGGVVQWARRRRARTAGRAPGRGPGGRRWAASAAFFWISASVCSTESCRWAATSARSWVRIRSSRSAPRSETRREDPRPGDQQQADHADARRRPGRPGPGAASRRRSRPRTAPRPPAPRRRRPGRTTPSRRAPKTRRTGSRRPVLSSQRSRCASSAWRQSRATPTTPIASGQNTAPRPTTAWTTSTAPTPSAASATAGPASVSRRTRPGRRPPRVAHSAPGVAGSKRSWPGQHDPQPGVERQAEAAEHGGDHERRAHQHHRDPEVAGQAAGDAADQGGLGVAVGLARGPGRRRDGRSDGRDEQRGRRGRRAGGAHPPIVARPGAGATMRNDPGATPTDPAPPLPGRGPGFLPMVPTGPATARLEP